MPLHFYGNDHIHFQETMFCSNKMISIPLTITYVLFCIVCPSLAIRKTAALIIVSIYIIGLAYKIGSYRFRFDISYSIYLYHMILTNIWIYMRMPAGMKDFTILAVCKLGISAL